MTRFLCGLLRLFFLLSLPAKISTKGKPVPVPLTWVSQLTQAYRRAPSKSAFSRILREEQSREPPAATNGNFEMIRGQ